MSVFFSYYFLSARRRESFNFIYSLELNIYISQQKLTINRLGARIVASNISVFTLICEYCLHLWLFYFSLIEASLNKSDWLI